MIAGTLGWAVFPVYEIARGRCACGRDCGAPGKHPRTPHGVKDATTEPATIEAWAARWPRANWAATPGDAGLVIDVDPRNGGFDSLREWSAVDSTWAVNTGGGGRHYYFTTPEAIGNQTNWLPGVDVKALGGYVLLPGSNHLSGGSYAWTSPPPDAGPPPASRDLLDSIRQAAAGGLGQSDLEDTDSILQGVPEGSRDEVLFRAACRWRNQLGSRDAVTVLALHAAANCDPPFPQAEAMRKVEQAFAQERETLSAHEWHWGQTAHLMKPTSILDAMRSALLTPDDLDDLPDPVWLIDGIITTSSMSVLYGSPGLGKTFLALDWAMRIGGGAEWFDRKVKQGPVLYIYAEGVHGLKQRKAAWVQSTGLLDSDVRFFPRAVPLLDDDWVKALAQLTAELRPVLVVIDTLARATAGADENSVKDMSRAVAACDAVREASGSAVMLVHHTGKDGSNYRGSSAIEGAADTMLHLARKDDGSIALRCAKQKDAEEFDPIPVQLESVGPSAVVVPGVSTQRFVDDAARGQLVSVLGLHPATWMSASQIHSEAGLNSSLRTTQRRLQELFEAGVIERAENGKSYVYRAKGYHP